MLHCAALLHTAPLAIFALLPLTGTEISTAMVFKVVCWPAAASLPAHPAPCARAQLSLMTSLRLPIIALPGALGNASEAWVSLGRIARFMLSAELEDYVAHAPALRAPDTAPAPSAELQEPALASELGSDLVLAASAPAPQALPVSGAALRCAALRRLVPYMAPQGVVLRVDGVFKWDKSDKGFALHINDLTVRHLRPAAAASS
jgi:hypothetical protein